VVVASPRLTDTDHLGHHPRNLSRRIELPFRFARIRSRNSASSTLRHPPKIVTSARFLVKSRLGFSKIATRFERRSCISLPRPSFIGIVEIRHVDHAFEFIGFCQPAMILFILVADIGLSLQRHHIRKAAALGDHNQRILLPRVLVRDVLDEQQHQHIVFILRSVHSAAQLSQLAQITVEFRFLSAIKG